MENDIYSYIRLPDGEYIITKNGDHFLTCNGSESDAKHIVHILNSDVERMKESKNVKTI